MSDSPMTEYISPSVPLSFVKPTAPGLLHRCRAFPQTHLDPDVRAFKRLAQVLRLRRALRRPADDADLGNALECSRQERKQVAAAGDDGLLAVGERDGSGLEHVRGKGHSANPLENPQFGQGRGG